MADTAAPQLAVVADLSFEVSDERGATTGHLSSDDDGLVLRVSDPATLLRALPRRGLRPDLPPWLPLASFANIPIRLLWRDRDLGRIYLTFDGRVRGRPSFSGVSTLRQTATAKRIATVGVAVIAVGVAGVVVYALRRRGS